MVIYSHLWSRSQYVFLGTSAKSTEEKHPCVPFCNLLTFVMAHAGSRLNVVLRDTHWFLNTVTKLLHVPYPDIDERFQVVTNSIFSCYSSIYQTPFSSNNPLHNWYVHLHAADNALGFTTVSWIFNQHSLSHKLSLFSRTWMITVTVSVDLRAELFFYSWLVLDQMHCLWLAG